MASPSPVDASGGWRRYGLWAIEGALVALSIGGLASVGLFVLPVAFLVGARLLRRPLGADALGFVAGVGLMVLVVGLLNLDYVECRPDGTLAVAPGQSEASCGGTPPAPLLGAGATLTVASATAYLIARRRRRNRSDDDQAQPAVR